ncbi:hypothetical protein [Proteus phage RP7]|nr:hypothetical protein [Proteus phage RP7]
MISSTFPNLVLGTQYSSSRPIILIRCFLLVPYYLLLGVEPRRVDFVASFMQIT